MLKNVAVFTISFVSTEMCAWKFDVPLWDASLWGFIVASGLALSWDAVGFTAYRLTRPTDAQFMAHGVCPACNTGGSLVELTSHTDGTIVGCKRCQEEFDIRPGDKGPIIVRLGRPGNL